MKCPNLHKKSYFQPMFPWGGGQVPIFFFARSYMKYPQKNCVWNLIPMTWGGGNLKEMFL